MKAIVFILVLLIFATLLAAQTNQPVRLAIISEMDEAGPAADILTAQFSSDPKIQLLERNEIERVYREQGLSAGNRDYLKLGQILGADGLLLLNVNRTAQATNLTTRLIAVKPGVVLTTESFSWPLAGLPEWASSTAQHLGWLLAKLTVLEKDAIPVSIVNLRSAIQSDEARETEREVKLLTIQRLSQQRQFFVLERQRMELLGEEKELKSDDSPFWNGSYLLEGILDQNGYAKDTITLNARLTPPKGGAPTQIEVSGSRTNLAVLVNQLAGKVEESLRISSTANAWNAADEAQQYFDEANWALRWGVYSEAQMAADSAWALGKHDLDCALVRVKSYLAEVKADNVIYDCPDTTFTPPFAANGPPVQAEIRRMKAQHPTGMVYRIETNGAAFITHYIIANSAPNPLNIDRAARALELYSDFRRSSPDGEPELIPHGGPWNNWHNSDWYQLGIDDLVTASMVLEDFYFLPEWRGAAADKLAELRARARSVAEFISQAPSVHDSYFVGNRSVKQDELDLTIDRLPSISRCKLTWGALWQETPEDCVALYRELMASPVFFHFHVIFWGHQLQQSSRVYRGFPYLQYYGYHFLEPPRLVAWNEKDRPRVPLVWNSFLRELDNSTNILWQLESKAVRFADAQDEKTLGEAFTNLLDAMVENRFALLTNTVEVPHQVLGKVTIGWGVDDLLDGKQANIPGADFRTEYLPKSAAKDAEYAREQVSNAQMAAANRNRELFEKQKQFLTEHKPFNAQAFTQMFLFGFKNYSVEQALEIQPLLAAYETNMPPNATGLMGAVQANLSRIINPPAPGSRASVPPQTPKPAAVRQPPAVGPALLHEPEIVTNLLVVSRFSEIPLDGFQVGAASQVNIISHEWVERKLLLDFTWKSIAAFDENGNWNPGANGTMRAVAILDPETDHWEVIGRPGMAMGQYGYYHRVALWRGQVFACDEGQIKKYDSNSKEWKTVEISDGGNYGLFVVNEHLYAANGVTVFEIMDGGKSTRILASTRRQPPISALDTQELGTPSLFEGPGHSLRILTSHKIFTWTGSDWHEDSAAPPASGTAITSGPASGTAITTEDVLFTDCPIGAEPGIYRLPTEANAVEFCLGRKSGSKNIPNLSSQGANGVLPAKPMWKLPSGLNLLNLPAASHLSDLFLLVDHSEAHNVTVGDMVRQTQIVAKEGYHAKLLCLSPGLSAPQTLFLKFDAPGDCAPLEGLDPGSRQGIPHPPGNWMLFTSNFLVFENDGCGVKPGVWLMPVSQLEEALAPQKQAQRAQMAQAAAAAAAAVEQTRKNLLAKYDRNHNGTIDPDEKEEALDDPAFIESELDVIDANHNGWLDADELAYFDANTNKILDPKEQAGIEIAQHLLAERLLKEYDVKGDGLLDNAEFNDLAQVFMAGPRGGPRPDLSFQSADANHDGHVDLAELETLLKRQTLRALTLSNRMRGATPVTPMIGNPRQSVDSQRRFKEAVEFYWQNPGGRINKPPKQATP